MTRLTRFLTLSAVLCGLGCGCAPKNEATPIIVVAPGLKQRLMLMDRYKKGNDGRPRIPHVTVSEVSETEAAEAEAEQPQ